MTSTATIIIALLGCVEIWAAVHTRKRRKKLRLTLLELKAMRGLADALAQAMAITLGTTTEAVRREVRRDMARTGATPPGELSEPARIERELRRL